MHDLINDLATSVARDFFYRLDGEMNVSKRNENFEKFRHFSLIGPQFGSYENFNELQRAKRLRTFLPLPGGWLDSGHVELLHKLQFLRVLRLIRITEVPQSIGSLKHLRLPVSFGKLINLQHLDISDTPKLNKMPLGIGGLTSLQTLPKVTVKEANGLKISDLKELSDLQGRLSIIGLEKVIDPIQAKDAKLYQKKGLEVLEMEWSDNVFDDSRDETIEYEVLEELRPPPKLKILKILNNIGTRFPSWVGDPTFDHLTELTLSGCRSTHIRVGHLKSLKKLVVESMNEVKTVGFELLAPTNSNLGIAFPSLEVLKFYDMQGWQRWSINSGNKHGTPSSFPRLHEISLISCPQLSQVSIGLIPSLRFLRIEECSEAVLRNMVGLSSSLVELKMVNVIGFTQLHGEDLMYLGEVKHLFIYRCDELRYLWERESEACRSLVSLQILEVRDCKKLVSVAVKINCLFNSQVKPQVLQINGFKMLFHQQALLHRLFAYIYIYRDGSYKKLQTAKHNSN
ncbi:putative disease resistance protein At3g14460 [Lactuca sativa]|uniref:putative disease resistance protein At3g14460 n=1 Tax=Lactuca sativa TaxID=4236 RepID=UPI0022B045C1|nr:putative disease resistance protein At3g14460 [Lactuca sativa]